MYACSGACFGHKVSIYKAKKNLQSTIDYRSP